MRLFRLKSRFSKHRAAPRLVLWQAKQCFIRENCGGAVALVVVELLRLALIDDHSSPRPKEAKNYKTQQVSLSAGVPRSYTTLLLPRPAELGSVRVMRKFAKTTFWHLLDSFHSAAAATTLFLDWICYGRTLLASLYTYTSRSRKLDALDEAALQGQKN